MSDNLYKTLACKLEERIRARLYGTEGGLPPTQEIADTYNMSVSIAKQALTYLEGKGLLEKKGPTFYVKLADVPMIEYTHPLPARFAMRDRLAYHENIVDPIRVELPGEIADKVGLARNTNAVLRYRVGIEQLTGDKIKPFRLARYYYILPVSDRDVQRLHSDPDLDLIVEEDIIRLSAEDEIVSRMTTPEEMDLLQLDNPVACTQVDIVTRDSMSSSILLIQRLVLLDVVLVYGYTFDNRPQS